MSSTVIDIIMNKHGLTESNYASVGGSYYTVENIKRAMLDLGEAIFRMHGLGFDNCDPASMAWEWLTVTQFQHSSNGADEAGDLYKAAWVEQALRRCRDYYLTIKNEK